MVFSHLTEDNAKRQFLNPVIAVQKTIPIRAIITQKFTDSQLHYIDFWTPQEYADWRMDLTCFVSFLIVLQLVAKPELGKEVGMCWGEGKKRKNLQLNQKR